MTLLFALLSTRAIAQDCPDPAAAVRQAAEHLLLLEESQAGESLKQAEDSFACRPVEPSTLARYWLVDAAVAHTTGDAAGARASFAAAALVDPEEWMTDLGAELEAIYNEIRGSAPANGTLEVVGSAGYVVRVDGTVRRTPVELPGGTHLLQVTDGDAVLDHRLLVIVPDQGTSVDPGLPDRSPPPEDTSPPFHLQLHSGLGLGLAQGDAIQSADITEPATKLSLPVEAGLIARVDRLWLRLHAAYAPMLDGELLYLSNNQVAGANAFVDLAASAGVGVGGFDVGLMAAQTIPSRNSLRAMLARNVAGPVGIELRGGVNLHPKRSAEAAGSVLLVVRPELF